MKKLLLASAALLALGLSAAAQSTGLRLQPQQKIEAARAAQMPAEPLRLPPSLKAEAVVDAAVVKLGDLILNAGAAADAAVFHAPDLGATGTIQAARVMAAARDLGLEDVQQNGFTSVIVRRASREISAEEIRAAVSEALARRHDVPRQTHLAFDALRAFAVEARAMEPLRLAGLAFDFRTGRFEAQIDVPGSAIAAERKFRFAGSAGDSVQAAVLAKPLNKGDVIQASDLSMEQRKRADLTSDMLIDPARLAGLALRRAARSGTLLRETDLSKPDLVERGANVIVTYEQSGIILSMRGKALASGSLGDAVTVQNPQSKKIVEGRVAGQGRVEVRALALPVPVASVQKSEERP